MNGQKTDDGVEFMYDWAKIPTLPEWKILLKLPPACIAKDQDGKPINPGDRYKSISLEFPDHE